MLDPNTLRTRLRYESDTGRLFWKERPPTDFATARAYSTHIGRDAGREAFTATNAGGYRVGSIDNKLYRAHRVIWALVHGEWPKGDVDHINGDRADNRLFNLREATRSQNLANARTRRAGPKGAFKKDGRWFAQIQVSGQRYFRGPFMTELEAGQEYLKMARTFQGDYARSDGVMTANG